jgi:hypothetical protein
MKLFINENNRIDISICFGTIMNFKQKIQFHTNQLHHSNYGAKNINLGSIDSNFCQPFIT